MFVRHTGYTVLNMREDTTIRISMEMRDALKAYGRKDETYTDLIRRLLKEVKEK